MHMAARRATIAATRPRRRDARRETTRADATRRRDDAPRPRCPCCGLENAKTRHLSLCAPDALRGDAFAARERDILRASVVRRHGERSRAHEIMAWRFGWARGARGATTRASEVARRVGRVDAESVARTIRREVEATPMGLACETEDVEALEILHEDEEMTCVNKRAGTASTPESRVADSSAASLVVARWRRRLVDAHDGALASNVVLGASLVPYVAHRLDLETSGALVVCKNAKAAARAQGAFERREVEKTYLALCRCDEFDVSGGGASSGTIDLALAKRDDGARFFVETSSADGKPASTEWTIVARNRRHALVRCRPKTGRTHQIRVHLAAIGLPIVGDAAYGCLDADVVDRHALHAWTLRFPAKDFAGVPRIVAPVPDDFRRACERVGVDFDFDAVGGE